MNEPLTTELERRRTLRIQCLPKLRSFKRRLACSFSLSDSPLVSRTLRLRSSKERIPRVRLRGVRGEY